MVRLICKDGVGWVSPAYAASARRRGWLPGYTGLDKRYGVFYLFRGNAPCQDFAVSQLQRLPLRPAIQYANLEPTDCCNLRCRYCVRPTQTKGMLSVPLAKHALKEIATTGAQYVSLCFAGEPMLHPKLPEIVKFACSLGLATSIDTNGFLLTAARLQALLEAGLTKLTISMDGGNASSYALLRGRDDYQQLRDRVLCSLDGITASPSFRVVVSIMRPPEADLFVALEELACWKRAPVSHIKLFYPHNWADASLLPHEKSSHLCPQPWTNLTVTCTGDVLPCDIDLGKHLVMGSLKKANLAEILKGPTYQQLLKAHLTGQLPAVCRSCLFRARTVSAK